MPQSHPALSPAGRSPSDEGADAFRHALSGLSLAADAVAEVVRGAIVRCFTDSGLQNPDLASILVRRSATRDLATLLGALFSALDPRATRKQEHLRELLQRTIALDRHYTQLLEDHVRGRQSESGPGSMRLVRRGSAAALRSIEDWTDEANALEIALKVWAGSLGQPARETSAAEDLTPELPKLRAEPSNPVATRWLDAWNRHDPERLRAAFANGAVYIDSGLDHELSGAIIASHVSRIFKEYPDISFAHLRGEHLDQHTWAGLWSLSAGQAGDEPSQLPPAALDLQVGVFLRIKDDRIQAAHVDFDLDPEGDAVAVLSEDLALRERARQRDDQLQERVSLLLESDRAFVDSKLALASVSEQLGVSPHHLSRLLHCATGSGLQTLLIQMRLDEAERLLGSPSADTAVLEEIATSVGFKSSSAFRLAFKDRTGMTPGQYRRERGGTFEL